MRFEDSPLINSATLFRRAGVTPYHGKRVITRLTDEGRIRPVITGTNREILTPKDGEVLFDALVMTSK